MGGDGGGAGHGWPNMVPVMTREAMKDQVDGMGPHRSGFPERSMEVRDSRADQNSGMVDMRPLWLILSEVRVTRLDQEGGRVLPRDGDLRRQLSEMLLIPGVRRLR